MIPADKLHKMEKEVAYTSITEEQAKQAVLEGATVYALTHRTLNYTEYFVASSPRDNELSLDK